jgi:hypothetical protein
VNRALDLHDPFPSLYPLFRQPASTVLHRMNVESSPGTGWLVAISFTVQGWGRKGLIPVPPFEKGEIK